MNKKEIIVTNTIRYKIYRFFRRIFSKSPNKDNRNNTIQIKPDNKFIQNISYKNEIISLNKQKELAGNLMSGKLNTMDLSDEEVNEMTEYFYVYIKEMNKKIDQIKTFIIDLKNKN